MFKSIQTLIVRCWKLVSPATGGVAGFVADDSIAGQKESPSLTLAHAAARAADVAHDFQLLKAFTASVAAESAPLSVNVAQDFPLLGAFLAAVLAADPAAVVIFTRDNVQAQPAPAAATTAAVVSAFAPAAHRRPANILAAQLRAVSARNAPISRKHKADGKNIKSAGRSRAWSSTGGMTSAQRPNNSIVSRHRPAVKLTITKRSPRRRHVWLTGIANPALARPTAAILRFQVRPATVRSSSRPHRIAA